MVDSTQQLVRKPASTIVVIPLLRRMKSRLVLAKVSSPRLPDNNVAGLRGERVNDGRTPTVLHEGVAVDDALENPVRVGGDLVVASGEGNGRVHDRRAGGWGGGRG